MTNFRPKFCLGLSFLAAVLFVSGARGGASSEALQVDAILVWGSNGKAEDKKLKPVGEALQAQLGDSLKWSHYYEISDKSFQLTGSKAHRARMSDKCEVEVKRVGEREVNVRLIGEGKVVVSRRQSLNKDDSVVLGGPCKDESAWFVVLRFK